jgi:tetratricopeptide (TPR) repeat protein
VQMSFWTHTAVSQREQLESRARESIAILERIPKSASLGEAWYGLGRLHEASGANAEAASAYKRGVEVHTQALGETHASVAGGRQMRARVLGFSGEFDEAARELKRAKAQFESTVGAEHRYSIDADAELGEVMHQLGDPAAISLLERAHAGQTKLRGAGHNGTLRTQRILAEALFDVGRYAEVLRHVDEMSARNAASASPSNVFAARIMSLKARTLLRTENLPAADEVTRAAAAAWRSVDENYGRGVAELDLADLHRLRGETDESRAAAQRALVLLAPMQGKTRNEYWRARLAAAQTATSSEKKTKLKEALSALQASKTRANYPRAEALLLEALAAAEVASGETGACATWAIARDIRARIDGATSMHALRLASIRPQFC